MSSMNLRPDTETRIDAHETRIAVLDTKIDNIGDSLSKIEKSTSLLPDITITMCKISDKLDSLTIRVDEHLRRPFPTGSRKQMYKKLGVALGALIAFATAACKVLGVF